MTHLYDQLITLAFGICMKLKNVLAVRTNKTAKIFSKTPIEHLLGA
jgi:hypothetical protein